MYNLLHVSLSLHNPIHLHPHTHKLYPSTSFFFTLFSSLSPSSDKTFIFQHPFLPSIQNTLDFLPSLFHTFLLHPYSSLFTILKTLSLSYGYYKPMFRFHRWQKNNTVSTLLTKTAKSAWQAPPIMLGTKLLWPGASRIVKCFCSVSKYALPTSTVLPLSRSVRQETLRW